MLGPVVADRSAAGGAPDRRLSAAGVCAAAVRVMDRYGASDDITFLVARRGAG